jgi:outer membrane murein-binding lipoprotein Lpp
MNHLPIALLVLLLAGCAATPDSRRITTAATTPLSDLNLVTTPIPPLLLEARQRPYALPPVTGCEDLAAAVAELDALLGPDVDAAKDEAERDLVDRGSEAVGDAAIGAIQGAAAGVLPFRSWLRKLSGAEKHSKEVAAAIGAGLARRAFLKGLRIGLHC